MSAFCICFCCTSHLWNVRLLWSCPLTWTKTFKNTGLSKGKTSLLLLWSLLCTCLCGENQCYNFVEKFCDKIIDELGDQFNESPIIVTNIMIKFVRILVKRIGEGVRSRSSLSPERRKNSWRLYFNPQHQYLITRVFLGPIAFRICITLICAKCS